MLTCSTVKAVRTRGGRARSASLLNPGGRRARNPSGYGRSPPVTHSPRLAGATVPWLQMAGSDEKCDWGVRKCRPPSLTSLLETTSTAPLSPSPNPQPSTE